MKEKRDESEGEKKGCEYVREWGILSRTSFHKGEPRVKRKANAKLTPTGIIASSLVKTMTEETMLRMKNWSMPQKFMRGEEISVKRMRGERWTRQAEGRGYHEAIKGDTEGKRNSPRASFACAWMTSWRGGEEMRHLGNSLPWVAHLQQHLQ